MRPEREKLPLRRKTRRPGTASRQKRKSLTWVAFERLLALAIMRQLLAMTGCELSAHCPFLQHRQLGDFRNGS